MLRVASFLLSCISIATVIDASPMENVNSNNLVPHYQYSPSEVWLQDPNYTLWDINSDDTGINIDDISNSQNEGKIGIPTESSSIAPMSTSSLIQDTNTIPKRERKGYCFVKKELGFARVKLQQKKMTWEHWQGLLDCQDPIALQIKKDFDSRCDHESKYAQLVRKLKKDPENTTLIASLKDFNRSKEDLERLQRVNASRPLMSKSKNDKISKLVRKIRGDIEDFNTSKRFRNLRSTATEKRRQQAMMIASKKTLNPKCKEGDAIAEGIIGKMEQFRILFRQEPYDESVWGRLLQDINTWLQHNQTNYIQFPKPSFDSISDNVQTDAPEFFSKNDSKETNQEQGEDDEWLAYDRI